jgi:hypothetical protein
MGLKYIGINAMYMLNPGQPAGTVFLNMVVCVPIYDCGVNEVPEGIQVDFSQRHNCEYNIKTVS